MRKQQHTSRRSLRQRTRARQRRSTVTRRVPLTQTTFSLFLTRSPTSSSPTTCVAAASTDHIDPVPTDCSHLALGRQRALPRRIVILVILCRGEIRLQIASTDTHLTVKSLAAVSVGLLLCIYFSFLAGSICSVVSGYTLFCFVF